MNLLCKTALGETAELHHVSRYYWLPGRGCTDLLLKLQRVIQLCTACYSTDLMSLKTWGKLHSQPQHASNTTRIYRWKTVMTCLLEAKMCYWWTFKERRFEQIPFSLTLAELNGNMRNAHAKVLLSSHHWRLFLKKISYYVLKYPCSSKTDVSNCWTFCTHVNLLNS